MVYCPVCGVEMKQVKGDIYLCIKCERFFITKIFEEKYKRSIVMQIYDDEPPFKESIEGKVLSIRADLSIFFQGRELKKTRVDKAGKLILVKEKTILG